MSNDELSTPVSIASYVPSHLIVIDDDGKHMEAVSSVFSAASIDLITEAYGGIIGVYSRADGSVVLLLQDKYIDLEKIVEIDD